MAHSPEELFAALDRLGIRTQTADHEPVFTVAESRVGEGGLIPGAHTKNLFLRDNKKTFFLISVEQDRAVDLKRMRPMIGAKGGLSFASPEALMELLGIRPGSVSPFAVINDQAGIVKVFLDDVLMQAPVINCHPLVNTKTTSIAPDDLLAFLSATGHQPGLLSFSAEEPEKADQALA